MKPLRQAVASAVAAIIVLFSGSSLLGQDVALRYRWTKGEALRYRLIQETNIVMSGIPGMGEMNVANTMTQVQKMTTQDVAADGTATVEALFESIKMEMGTPMGNFVYDSTAPQNNADPMVAQVAGMMGALIGESITLVISPTGGIQKTEGMTRIMQKVQQSPQGAAIGMAGLDSMLSDDSMKGAFGQSLANLPEKPVKPGDTWKSEILMPNPFGNMNIATTYTLKGVESTGGHDLARIATSSAIKATPGSNPPAFPMPVKIEFTDGKGDGELVFDRKLGRTHQATFSMTLPMTMNMTTPDGQTLNLQALTKTTTKMELIEK
jgi:Family of unknown function (DUF6263)